MINPVSKSLGERIKSIANKFNLFAKTPNYRFEGKYIRLMKIPKVTNFEGAKSAYFRLVTSGGANNTESDTCELSIKGYVSDYGTAQARMYCVFKISNNMTDWDIYTDEDANYYYVLLGTNTSYGYVSAYYLNGINSPVSTLNVTPLNETFNYDLTNTSTILSSRTQTIPYSGSVSNQYSFIRKIRIGQAGSYNETFLLHDSETLINHNSAIYQVGIRINDLGATPQIVIDNMTGLYQKEHEIIAVVTKNTTAETIVELYVKVLNGYSAIVVKSLSRSVRNPPIYVTSPLSLSLSSSISSGNLVTMLNKYVTQNNTYLNGWSPESGANYFVVENNKVTVFINITGGTAGFGTNILNIPDPYRPTGSYRAPAYWSNGTTSGCGSVTIFSSGNIQINDVKGNSILSAQLTYYLG